MAKWHYRCPEDDFIVPVRDGCGEVIRDHLRSAHRRTGHVDFIREDHEDEHCSECEE